MILLYVKIKYALQVYQVSWSNENLLSCGHWKVLVCINYYFKSLEVIRNGGCSDEVIMGIQHQC